MYIIPGVQLIGKGIIITVIAIINLVKNWNRRCPRVIRYGEVRKKQSYSSYV